MTNKFYLAEKVFVIAVSLLSCFVFAYSMNSIGNKWQLLINILIDKGEILKEMGRKEENFKKKMATLNIYMAKRGLSP